MSDVQYVSESLIPPLKWYDTLVVGELQETMYKDIEHRDETKTHIPEVCR